MNDAGAWLVATLSGLTLWSLANFLEGSQEPWDVETYWTIWLPLAAVVCFVLGFAFPERPWRWPLAVMLAQLPVMLAFTGEVGAFLVLGIGLLLGYSLLGMLFASLGAVVRRRFAA